MEYVKKYLKPLSLSWWMGVTLLASGLLRIWSLDIPGLSPIVRPLIDAFQSSDPATLIVHGLGVIGIRGAIK